VMASNEAEITEEHLSDDFHEDILRMPPLSAKACAVGSAAQPVPEALSPVAPALVPPAAERTLEESEIALIQAAVDAADGNISRASKKLGISRNTIYRKLRWAK